MPSVMHTGAGRGKTAIQAHKTRSRKANNARAASSDYESTPPRRPQTGGKLLPPTPQTGGKAPTPQTGGKAPVTPIVHGGRGPGRFLLHWTENMDRIVLLNLVYALEVAGTKIPWDDVAKRLAGPRVSGKAVTQHVNKIRATNLKAGAAIPPIAGMAGHGSREIRAVRAALDVSTNTVKFVQVGWNEDMRPYYDPNGVKPINQSFDVDPKVVSKARDTVLADLNEVARLNAGTTAPIIVRPNIRDREGPKTYVQHQVNDDRSRSRNRGSRSAAVTKKKAAPKRKSARRNNRKVIKDESESEEEFDDVESVTTEDDYQGGSVYGGGDDDESVVDAGQDEDMDLGDPAAEEAVIPAFHYQRNGTVVFRVNSVHLRNLRDLGAIKPVLENAPGIAQSVEEEIVQPHVGEPVGDSEPAEAFKNEYALIPKGENFQYEAEREFQLEVQSPGADNQAFGNFDQNVPYNNNGFDPAQFHYPYNGFPSDNTLAVGGNFDDSNQQFDGFPAANNYDAPANGFGGNNPDLNHVENFFQGQAPADGNMGFGNASTYGQAPGGGNMGFGNLSYPGQAPASGNMAFGDAAYPGQAPASDNMGFGNFDSHGQAPVGGNMGFDNPYWNNYDNPYYGMAPAVPAEETEEELRQRRIAEWENSK